MNEKEEMTREDLVKQCDYLREECNKLNTELRQITSDNRMLKETIVKMAMRQNGVVE